MKAFSTAVSRIAAGLCLACGAVLATGCAPATPMFQQLEHDRTTQINLIVEKAPFEYTPPVNPESPIVGAGFATVMLGSLAVQHKLGYIHETLNQKALEQKIANDYRPVFVAALVQELTKLGITATVIPLPYERRALNHDRAFYRPTLEDLAKIPKEPPSFYLKLDMGSCTVYQITPCIRYILNSTEVETAPGPTQKYGGMLVLEPNLWTVPTVPTPLRFESIEEAGAKIHEFDAEIARLVPLAAQRLAVAARRRVPPR
jgi:hypothetical protein